MVSWVNTVPLYNIPSNSAICATSSDRTWIAGSGFFFAECCAGSGRLEVTMRRGGGRRDDILMVSSDVCAPNILCPHIRKAKLMCYIDWVKEWTDATKSVWQFPYRTSDNRRPPFFLWAFRKDVVCLPLAIHLDHVIQTPREWYCVLVDTIMMSETELTNTIFQNSNEGSPLLSADIIQKETDRSDWHVDKYGRVLLKTSGIDGVRNFEHWATWSCM